MNELIIKSDAIILPSGLWSGYITAKNGKITAITKEPPSVQGEFIDATGLFVSPGFVDIHTHGGGGYDFMDGDALCIKEAAMAHMRHGTTTIVPTSLASDIEDIYRFLDNFHSAKRDLADGPCLLGVHLEGPYFSKAQAGAQDPRYIKDPATDEYKSIVEYGKGAIVRWSAAPELHGAFEMGDFLKSKGILPSIAHSDAEYSEIQEARNHYYSLVTHLYSGMSSIVRRGGYRHLGVVESAYIIEDLDVEVIADGHHLPIELLGMIYKFKGPDRIALVTDSMRAAGMPPGEYILGSMKTGQKIIVEDGVAKLPDKSAFAGSIATADRLVRVIHKQAGVDLVQTVRMMTATPSRILGINNRKGSIAVHMDCDLVLFNDNIEVSAVITQGTVWRANRFDSYR